MDLKVRVRRRTDGQGTDYHTHHPAILPNSTGNLFVRLPPSTARHLRDIALAGLPKDGRRDRHSWSVASSIQSEMTESGIEFLPLKVCLFNPSCGDCDGDSGQQYMYVSYNGGSIREDGNGEFLLFVGWYFISLSCCG